MMQTDSTGFETLLNSDEKSQTVMAELRSKYGDKAVFRELIADFNFFISLILFREFLKSTASPDASLEEIIRLWRERAVASFEIQILPLKETIEQYKNDPSAEIFVAYLQEKLKSLREKYIEGVRNLAGMVKNLIMEEGPL